MRLKAENQRLDKRFREEAEAKLNELKRAGEYADFRVQMVRKEAVTRIEKLEQSIDHLHVARKTAEERLQITSNRANEEKLRADNLQDEKMCRVCIEERCSRAEGMA